MSGTDARGTAHPQPLIAPVGTLSARPPRNPTRASKANPSAAGLTDLRAFAPRLTGIRLTSLAAASALGEPALLQPAALSAAAGDGGGLNSPKVSGLAWRSGASCGQDGFTSWRGRQLDVNVGFVQHDTWDRMFTYLRSGWFKGVVM
jgi:hypothetical protein